MEITGVTLAGILNGDDVSVATTGLTGTLNGSDVGTYTAVTLPRLTLTGGAASNYTLTQPAGAITSNVTIRKAPALTPKTGDLAVANKQEHTYTYGLGALRPDVPEGMSLGSSAVTYTLGTVSLGGYYDSAKDGAKIEGQTLTLPIEAVQNDKAEEIGTVTVTIHTQNFEDMTATIDVRSVNKIIPTGGPNLSGNTLTYGQALSAITLSGNMKDGETPVPGKFEWSNPDNRPAVQENYAAAWIFTPDDNKTYAIVTGTALIQVLPAPITGVVIVLDHMICSPYGRQGNKERQEGNGETCRSRGSRTTAADKRMSSEADAHTGSSATRWSTSINNREMDQPLRSRGGSRASR